jgi:membrane-associated phospholipid phosphatase
MLKMAAEPLNHGIERRNARSTFKGAVISAALSLLFLVVYGGCNWITSRRSDVGLLNFGWEQYLPFVPMLIVPYLSIDLFFIAAPFLFRTHRELSIFTKRVTLAILLAGICFLLFPFRFAFARPHADGWTGALFDWFRGMDAPYNLFPSLHVTLCLLLADAYARHTRGVVRLASVIWFVLIGLSAVLTYQHHLLDVVGGLALAGYCFYWIPESSPHLPVITNFRIGSYYVAGGIASMILIILLRPWGWVLVWPAVAFAIVSSAYFGIGPSIFRKTRGALPIGTRFALGPCLVGQRVSLSYYRRQCRAWDQITPQVWIGSVLNNREAGDAIRMGVTAVLDLTAEFSENKQFRSLCYRNIPVLDLTQPTLDQLNEMSDFIEEQMRAGVVYVHCKIGYSRSATAVAGWLCKTGRTASVDEAIIVIRKARPTVVIRPEALAAVRDFCSRFRSSIAV